MTTPASPDQSFKRACRAVARAMVPKERIERLQAPGQFQDLVSRFSTFQILLAGEIAGLQKSPARANTLALIPAADLCWQTLRALGGHTGETGKDKTWLEAALPRDHVDIEADLDDGYFAQQRRIVEDAVWIFNLHSKLRHPVGDMSPLLPLFRDPVPDGDCARLLPAARAVRQVLPCAQVGFDPAVTVGSEPV